MKNSSSSDTGNCSSCADQKSRTKLGKFFSRWFSSCCSIDTCSGTCCSSDCGCNYSKADDKKCGCGHGGQIKSLSDLKTGQTGTVLGVKHNSACQFKLLDLGLCTGIDIIVKERAPFGGPMIIKAKGTTMALRPSEAACINVSLTN